MWLPKYGVASNMLFNAIAESGIKLQGLGFSHDGWFQERYRSSLMERQLDMGEIMINRLKSSFEGLHFLSLDFDRDQKLLWVPTTWHTALEIIIAAGVSSLKEVHTALSGGGEMYGEGKGPWLAGLRSQCRLEKLEGSVILRGSDESFVAHLVSTQESLTQLHLGFRTEHVNRALLLDIAGMGDLQQLEFDKQRGDKSRSLAESRPVTEDIEHLVAADEASLEARGLWESSEG